MIAWSVVALASTPPRVEEARAAVDWDQVEAEAADWLSSYLQIDTTAPPGNERDGAEFLRGLLRREGFTTQLVDHGDNRASLIARYSTGGSEAPLCLLSHIDVVPAEAERWSRPPLSGAIEDGFVWGRGAIDMKGMGIMEVSAAIQVARAGLPLNRDIVVLAVADEEVSGLGIRTLVADHWDAIGCSDVINEGGLGVQDALFEGQTVHAISVAEKGVLWAHMIADGAPGHGSTIEEGEAPARLLEAMQKVDARYKPKTVLTPPLVEMLERVGEHKGGFTGGVLKSGVGRGLMVKPKLASSTTTASLVTTTVHLTGMEGSGSTNVVPGTVKATYDCRLLPGVEPNAFLAELEELTSDVEGIRWEVELGMVSNGSPMDTPLFGRLAHYAVEGEPGAVAAPVLSPGFTDSLYIRPTGANAYGYIPVSISQGDRNRMHGDDERISLANLRRGIRVLHAVIVDFAGGDALPPDLAALDAELAALPRGTDPASIATELAARVAIDQRVRKALIPGEVDQASIQQMRWVDVRNTRRMREVLESHGWPTRDTFGEQGSSNAWLLVQHADLDPAFQVAALAMMEPHLDSGEIRKKDYAYLVDRVAFGTGELQTYGTQGRCNADATPYPRWEPNPMVDPDGVDERRASMGLPSMATYTGWFDCSGLKQRARKAYEAGEWSRCADLYSTAAERSTRPHTLLYNGACCAARAGETDRAYELLRQSLDAGVEPETARDDDDLESLRGDPRWDSVVGGQQAAPR